MYTIRGDIHTHTLFSRHAYSTIQENVAAAAQAGLEIFGSADHFSSMLFCEQDIKNFQYFVNTGIWPREWMGVHVLRGCEVDIVSLDGGLFGQDIPVPETIVGSLYQQDKSLFERVTANLDYLIASVHNAEFTFGASIAQTTAMYVKALEHPRVFVLGHTGRSGVSYDLQEVLSCAREHHKLIEINEHSLDGMPFAHAYSRCKEIAIACAEMGVGICVNTDAHIAPHIGVFSEAIKLLEAIHFPEHLIMNRSKEVLLAELEASGVRA
ncbi:phosphatase [Collinsella sp. zg1085]|uniref:phosphatase n=1 Tax=Collinsella sp. zg1085 TaxID=2844380 RepID=UPI001C0E0F29|nr:phosphatase [Collinsella sp. zg1085]QWT17695.1 phosphatase [Collinsella sp. zg1085]